MEGQKTKEAFRERALVSALQINPTQYIQQSQVLAQATHTSPTPEKILQDADKFYNWLIKDL